MPSALAKSLLTQRVDSADTADFVDLADFAGGLMTVYHMS